MEGPTPVSALIHAATMVVAGVYMVARMLPLFEVADPIALDVVTILGLTTVMLSATMGLAATDIKRVIAYSTLNSLGLMFVALGSHSVTAAMLYLFVHGFFKAMLFLGSGSVIHATEKQDVNELGGLLKKMPITGYTFAHRRAGDDRYHPALRLLGEGRGAASPRTTPRTSSLPRAARQPRHHRPLHDAALHPDVPRRAERPPRLRSRPRGRSR